MINAKSLMVDNLVLFIPLGNKANPPSIIKVKGIVGDSISTEFKGLPLVLKAYSESISGVPLTEEVLLACGFKKYSHEPGYSIGSDELDEKCNEYSLDKLSIMDWGNGFILSNSFSFDLRITLIFLHQLQNLYFSLTGKELIYNPIK